MRGERISCSGQAIVKDLEIGYSSCFEDPALDIVSVLLFFSPERSERSFNFSEMVEEMKEKSGGSHSRRGMLFIYLLESYTFFRPPSSSSNFSRRSFSVKIALCFSISADLVEKCASTLMR